MSDPDKIVILCLSVSDADPKSIHKESVISKCDRCNRKIFCMPHNLKYEKQCIACMRETAKNEDCEFQYGVKADDLEKAKEHIRENDA